MDVKGEVLLQSKIRNGSN